MPHPFSRNPHAALRTIPDRIRVLVTGAGGASAQSVLKSLDGAGFTVIMADMDPLATGLHLVPASQRVVLLPGAHPDFAAHVLQMALRHSCAAVWSTVDVELEPLAAHAHSFADSRIILIQASAASLAQVLDKGALMVAAQGVIATPVSAILTSEWLAKQNVKSTGPWLVKPRRGAGSRGITQCQSLADVAEQPMDGSCLVQEYLPGEELSVDVLASPDGKALVAVPRIRLRVDSGIAIVSRTVRDPELSAAAMALVSRLQLPYVSNVQVRRDAAGVPRLLEINPRVPGTMPLTIAAGVNMPLLALMMALGDDPPSKDLLAWKELGMVRQWAETWVDIADLGRTVRAELQ